jgi:hypothetical protein
VNRNLLSIAGGILLGFVGEQIHARSQRERSEVGEAIAIHGAGFRGSLLLRDLLVARESAVLAPEDAVLGHMLAEVR